MIRGLVEATMLMKPKDSIKFWFWLGWLPVLLVCIIGIIGCMSELKFDSPDKELVQNIIILSVPPVLTLVWIIKRIFRI